MCFLPYGVLVGPQRGPFCYVEGLIVRVQLLYILSTAPRSTSHIVHGKHCVRYRLFEREQRELAVAGKGNVIGPPATILAAALSRLKAKLGESFGSDTCR